MRAAGQGRVQPELHLLHLAEAMRDPARYLTELTRTEMRQYYRGNLFTNTPDILPHYLAAAVRRSSAAWCWPRPCPACTASIPGSSCSSTAHRDRRGVRNSEKYEILVRDWDAPGNLKPLITALNDLRREWPALRRNDNLRFEGTRAEADPVLSQGAAGWAGGPAVRGSPNLASTGVGGGQRVADPVGASGPPSGFACGRYRSRAAVSVH